MIMIFGLLPIQGHSAYQTVSGEEKQVVLESSPEGEYINPYYENYPRTENTSNFHSLATASFDDINGVTVTVDTLYRKYQEALNDPNFAMAVLIDQCIKYKKANPEEDVSIHFSSFRISPTAAACLNEESRYYGYMRSLYDTREYDDNGFVRVVYLLVDAAKHGIDVTIVGHFNSYAVKQYNNETGKTYSAGEPSYLQYFKDRLTNPCYEEYDSGAVVGDHLRVDGIDWPYNDKTFTDVMHTKICAVSHYLDRQGVSHRYGVWLSSTNLDANNYKGHNGNGGSQSGVIITGHKEIYNICKNYVNLTIEHTDKEGLFKLRNKVTRANTEQAKLFLAGRQDEIPEEDRIIYLGSENDKVFELYFTPLGGMYDTWDTVNNPYCKYVQELYDSKDYVVVSWNNPNFKEERYIPNTILSVFRDKFITNPNPQNRINIRCQDSVFEGFSSLVVGEDVEFKNIKTTWDAVHEKDLLMSYNKGDERQYVSILNSCNFHVGAMYYQTNQILVIKETDSTGSVVFDSLGEVESKGAIKKQEGLGFSVNERQVVSDYLSSFPATVEADIELKKQNGVSTYGNIFSNNDFWSHSYTLRITKKGYPEVALGGIVTNKLRAFKEYKYTFKNVNVCTGDRLHLSIVCDKQNAKLHCYVDGVLKETLSGVEHLNENYVSERKYVVGGDWLGGNAAYFKGTIYSVSAYSDIRLDAEVLADKTSVDYTDSALMLSYDFTRTYNCYGGDKSPKCNNLQSERLWLAESAVEPVSDDEYCFAVVGDTQCLSWYHPDKMASIYDWILDNQESKNIQYVIGLGDMTEECLDTEWDNVTCEISKLNDKIPYSVIMGNHDKYDKKNTDFDTIDRTTFKFNQYFYNEQYLSQLDGWYGEGDVSCSYNAFEIGETKWLLLNLDFGPTAEMLDWACDVIESHPEHKVVIATHAYLYRDGSTLDDTECYPSSEHNSTFKDGDDIWNDLASKYENVVLVLSGHDPWDHIVCSQSTGDSGNVVTQLLINPQYMDKYYDATGMVALLYFSPDGNTMTVRYYSTTQECYGSASSQFTVSLTK